MSNSEEHVSESSMLQLFDNARRAVQRMRTEPIVERKKRLSLLRKWIIANRIKIQQAVHADFKKPAVEVDATEVFHVLNEIKVALSELDNWTAAKKIDAPLFMLGTRSFIHYEPKGVCLIISPWNYPFSLAVGPLVSALAAGNNAIIKPSEVTPHVSALIKEMSVDIFEPSVVSVCEGPARVSQFLLSLPFDHIFFTGSPAIGKVVMRAAAENLSSVTLELGGKCPAIVSASANIDDAAERIAVGKFMNNGQTCIAPDYLLVDRKVADKFLSRLVDKTKLLFSEGGNFESSPNYGRIVNQVHFDRVEALRADAISYGAKVLGEVEANKTSKFMSPVILTEVAPESRIMKEEIFGPLLPVMTFDDFEEAITYINEKPKPLAIYVFTSEKNESQKVVYETSAGTMCINDCGVQFLHHNLPFGGVNNSGIGKTHGHSGFLAFSNEKPVLKQKSGFTSVQAFYPPYTNRSKKLMDWFLKFF